MTNKEAIERLQMILDGDMTLYMMNEKDAEAVHYAIKVLEKGDRYNEGYLAGQACAKWRSGV